MNTLTTIEKKEKATLLLENTMGFIIVRHIWLVAYGHKKGSGMWDKEKVVAHYVEKGQRKVQGWKFEKATIAKGWQDVKGAFNSPATTEAISFDEKGFAYCESQLNDIIIKDKK